MKRTRRVALAALLLPSLALGAAACVPGSTPGTPESFYTYAHTEQAIDVTFGPRGAHVTACAHGVVDRESGHWPYAGFGKKYQGPWQMHAGFDQTIANLAAAYGYPIASRHDPYLSTMAALAAFDAAGGSFRRNWPGTTPAGCP